MKRKILLIFVLGLGLTTQGTTQDRPKLFADVERVFRETEGNWKVERRYPTHTSDPITFGIVFRSRVGQASVEIDIWKQTSEAIEAFTGLSLSFDNMAGKKMVKRTLPQMGDENHVWTNPGSTAWPTIKFRKGNVVVTVFAPSLVIGKRFAQHVLAQIDAS
jgi:hypothetical protein